MKNGEYGEEWRVQAPMRADGSGVNGRFLRAGQDTRVSFYDTHSILDSRHPCLGRDDCGSLLISRDSFLTICPRNILPFPKY